MNRRLPASINQWHIEFDPYGFSDQVDWLKHAERAEDILQLTHVKANGPIIDVGFYTYLFRACVIRNGDWDDPVETFESESEGDIEYWIYSALDRYANGF